MILLVLLLIFVAGWIWLGYELYNAPEIDKDDPNF